MYNMYYTVITCHKRQYYNMLLRYYTDCTDNQGAVQCTHRLSVRPGQLVYITGLS